MIIGLHGPAGSGKSTAAKHLVEKHGFIHLKFAGPLKAMFRALLIETGLPDDNTQIWIEGALKESECSVIGNKTPRHAMQTLGTQWGRHCMGDDFWVNVARQRVMSEFECCSATVTPRIVFDDVRFENEAAMIRELGGTIIHIAGRGGIEGSHESESGVEFRRGDDLLLTKGAEVEYMHGFLDEVVAFLDDMEGK